MKKVLCMVLAIVSLLVFNSKIEANELDVIDEYRNAIIIRDFTDVESLIREDEEKYNRKYNEIPETLKRDFYAFSETRMSTSLYRNNIKNDLSDFLAMYPQYNNIKDIENIKMLSDNPVAELVSGYFRKKGFKLSLMFF